MQYWAFKLPGCQCESWHPSGHTFCTWRGQLVTVMDKNRTKPAETKCYVVFVLFLHQWEPPPLSSLMIRACCSVAAFYTGVLRHLTADFTPLQGRQKVKVLINMWEILADNLDITHTEARLHRTMSVKPVIYSICSNIQPLHSWPTRHSHSHSRGSVACTVTPFSVLHQ